MEDALLRVRGLCKYYKKFTLREINMALPAGYIMGYVGANGAGKTTTLNAVSGLLKPDAGEVTVDGLSMQNDPVAYKRQIAYIGDSSCFPGDLNRNDVCKIFSDFYADFDKSKYNALADKWEIPQNVPVSKYSRGMAVKLMFAAAFSRVSKLLVLDEATNGLDPVVRREVLELLFILMYGAASVFLAVEGLVMTCFRFKSPQANAILRIIPVLLFFFVTMSLSEDTDIPNSVHRQMAYVLANAPLSLFLGLFGVVIFVCLGYAAGSVSAKREG